MQPTLERQLKRIFGSLDKVPVGIEELLEVVARTYEGSEEDRKMIERSLEISSRELSAINQQLIKEKAEKIRLEQSKTSAILQSIADGVFVTNKNSEVFMFNQAAEKISDLNVNDVNGKPFYQFLNFVGEKEGENRNGFIDEAIKRGSLQELPLHSALVTKDGEPKAIAATAAPLKDHNKKVIGCVVVFRDIAKERAIDKSKSEFVSLASHQLRTPLTGISWYTEMLLAGEVGKMTAPQTNYLKKVYTSNLRMVELVNALLNVSRLDLGTFIVEPEPADIIKIAQGAISEMVVLIKKRNITVVEKYGDLPKINLDKKLTHIIFQNLLSNAVKYSPEGSEVVLSIDTNEHDIIIEVADKGMGIPKRQQDRMFTKLFRADNVRGQDTTGTGLGLYIVKQILDHSGGKITFESEEGKGATFHINIPLTGMREKKGSKPLY